MGLDLADEITLTDDDTDLGPTVASGANTSYGSGGTIISAGDRLDVGSGSTASSITIDSGGSVQVFGGGTISGVAISGGTLTLSSGAIVVGAVDFTGVSGTLAIGGTTMPSTTISGFTAATATPPGDTIDLVSVPFDSAGGAVIASGGVLQIVASGSVYDLQLDPTQNFATTTPVLTNDGSGGTDITLAQRGLVIDVTYDPSVTAANFAGGATEEAEFKDAINYVVNLYETLFTNSTTLDIGVGWGEADGMQLGSGDLGESVTNIYTTTYGTVVSGLEAVEQSANQAAAYQTLSAADPTSGGTFVIASAEAKALDLVSANTGTDGWVGFSDTLPFNFATGNLAVAGEYYFTGVAEHEISEVMGRLSLAGRTIDGLGSDLQMPMDLFRYSAPGTRQLTTGTASYFSTDDGATDLDNWNNYVTGDHGDLGDWAPSAGDDAYLDASPSGTVDALTLTDLTDMNVIGYDTSAPSDTVPDGVVDYVGIAVDNAGNPVAATGFIVLGGGFQEVLSRGVTSATMLAGGGEIVENGGSSIATILSGGSEAVATGGTAGFSMIASGGAETVFGGDVSATIQSAGSQSIASGGTARAATIAQGGVQDVLPFGLAIAATVDGGGTTGDAGQDYVESRGTAIGTVLTSGADEFVEAGGTASATVSDGGSQIVYGAASGTMLTGSAHLYLESGTTVGTVVSNGVELVYGTASSTIDDNSGFDFVFSGGAADGTTLSGGEEYVEFGARASGTEADGGAQIVYGAVSATRLDSGADLYVELGGDAAGVSADSGAVVVLGSANGTVDGSGGADYIGSGGQAVGTVVGGSGAVEFVEIGGTASGTHIDGGTEVVYGVADRSVLYGGDQYVDFGGAASATVVDGGIVSILSGTAIGITDNGGGADYVDNAGTAINTQVDGGAEFVEAAGIAIDTMVSGGAQIVYGTVSGTVLNAGGVQYVSSGGTAGGTVVNSGGYEYAVAGGIVSGAIIGGGTLELAGGAVALGPAIAFAAGGGGTLRLDNSAAFSGTVAGFGSSDQIDLADIGFGDGTTLGFLEASDAMSGALTVASGTATANLTLLGQYVAAQFDIAGDGHGGTLVTDPQVTAMTDFAASLVAVSRRT